MIGIVIVLIVLRVIIVVLIHIVCVCPGTFRNGEVSQKGRGVFLEQGGGVLTTLRTMVLVLPYVKKKKKKKGECQCKILLFGLENY